MKNLFLIILFVGLLSCGMPDELELPDEDIKCQNGSIFYKNKKYTGKILVEDKKNTVNYKGYLNLKEGKLDGVSEILNSKTKEYFKFKVTTGEFDGEYITKVLNVIDASIFFEKGMIKKYRVIYPDNSREELTFDNDGLANGFVIENGKKTEFVKGFSDYDQKRVKISLTKDKRKQVIQVYKEKELLAEKEIDISLTPKLLEGKLFPILCEDGKEIQ